MFNRTILLLWKSSKYYILVCLCMHISAYSVANPARNAYAPYCDVINGAIFGKKVTEHKMCVFIFSITFVYNISHSKKNLARYRQKCRHVFMYSYVPRNPILNYKHFSIILS
jgi:hypothetical protein